MRTRNVVIVEISMIVGIAVSILLVPRALPITTFIAIAALIVIGVNVTVFTRAKPNSGPSKYKIGNGADIAIALASLFRVSYFS